MQFVIQLQPRLPNLLSNLAEVLQDDPDYSTLLGLEDTPFWPDVFIDFGVPWRSLLQSVLTHALFVAAIWAVSHAWLVRPRVIARPSFQPSQIIYYQVSEYLPAIKSPTARARVARPADPAPAPQEIVSVPPEADNRRQTIITPPNVKLAGEVPLPNLVAWTASPGPVPVPGSLNSKLTLPPISTPVVPPAPEVSRTRERTSPVLPQPSVIAPPPQVERAANRTGPLLPQPTAIAPAPETTSALAKLHAANAPQPAVIAPPPSAAALNRPLGTMEVAELQPQVAAPKLPLVPQQTASAAASTGAGLANGSPAGAGAAGPPAAPVAAPDAHAVGFGRPSGQLIALSVAPSAVSGPIAVPQGNRRGIFAAGPNGRRGASGEPGGNGRGTAESGRGSTHASSDKLLGITIAPGPVLPQPSSAPVVAGVPSRNLLALASIPSSMRNLPPRVHGDVPAIAPSDVDRQVFGGKKFYSITLNMPNLNSRSGSWVIRFAELNDDGARGELTAPVVVEKVDPAYPGLVMREHIEGTVTLYAVIGTDGSVGNVRVLRGVDGRLDAAARDALQHCHFRPATKNGTAVALEAVIRIPFEVHRIAY